MITVDASVLRAHLYPREPRHREATGFLRDCVRQDLVIHPVSLAEVLVEAVRAGRGQEMLADVHAIGVRLAEGVEGQAMRLAALRAEFGLDLHHCCALDTALVTGSSLATFDDALAQAARRRRRFVELASG